jgi:hypothetical protein
VLKLDDTVLTTLKKTGSYMKRHHWGQDKWEIVTLRFIVEIDPGCHMLGKVHEYILQLSKAKECITIPGSRFKLVAHRFKLKNKRAVFNTDAYAVQCMRIDAQAVDTMLQHRYHNTKLYA